VTSGASASSARWFWAWLDTICTSRMLDADADKVRTG